MLQVLQDTMSERDFESVRQGMFISSILSGFCFAVVTQLVLAEALKPRVVNMITAIFMVNTLLFLYALICGFLAIARDFFPEFTSERSRPL